MAEQQAEHAESAGYRVRWTERSSGVAQGHWCGSWLGAQLVARRLNGMLHFWQGATTPGGLAEAHEHVVEQVRTGQAPAQGTQDGGKGDG